MTASAQDYAADAFGVVLVSDGTSLRDHWADISKKPEKVEDVLLFVGQKSLTAGRQEGHAVSLLFDRFGNLVADGTEVKLILNGAAFNAATKNGVADVIFKPGTVAGTYDAGAISDGKQSARATYRVTADLSGLHPKVVVPESTSRPESFVDFETGPLTDQYGNMAPSGVGGQMVVTHPDGSFTVLPSIVLRGRAHGSMLWRDIPDTGDVRAKIGERVSNAASLRVEPLSRAAPSRLWLTAIPEIEATRIKVGPITTSAGHYLTDGANISVSITGKSGTSVKREGWIRDGAFSAIMAIHPEDLPFTVTVVTLLGEETTTIEHLQTALTTQGGASK